MPLNESLGQPSNLTEQQQREAMRAIYGLEPKNTMSPTNQELTFEERQKMRRYLDNLDQKDAKAQVFDLNKPPTPPYIYREYPRLMYKHDTREMRPAHNAEEHQFLVASGWSEKPAASAPGPEVELTPLELEEANAMDRQLKAKKK